jgi:hypothetical protein
MSLFLFFDRWLCNRRISFNSFRVSREWDRGGRGPRNWSAEVSSQGRQFEGFVGRAVSRVDAGLPVGRPAERTAQIATATTNGVPGRDFRAIS